MPQSGFKSGVSALLQRKPGSLSFASVRINQMFNIKFALSQQTKKKKKKDSDLCEILTVLKKSYQSYGIITECQQELMLFLMQFM